MQIAPVFETVFRGVYGKPCWGVKPGWGSFLTFEFGEPHLIVREPIVATKRASEKVRKALARRQVYARGDWHLWIYCCDWEVICKGKHVGDSSTTIKISRAADILNGQKLISFSILPRKVQSIFKFDLGATLRTSPFDVKSEQWLFYQPSEKVLVLRADGRYKYQRFDVPENRGEWKPIRAGN
jgi:hypothetical protein